MKIVSFEEAKYLKEAGYPQGLSRFLYNKDGYKEAGSLLSRYECEQLNLDTSTKIDAPYAVDVWFWLWREKKKWIDVSFSLDEGNWTFMQNPSPCDCGLYNDPEEAIIAAIEYLVDSDLIK